MRLFSFMSGKMHDEVVLHAGSIRALKPYVLSHLLLKYSRTSPFFFILVRLLHFVLTGGRKGVLVQRSWKWARILEAEKASANEIRKCHRNC